MVVSDRATIKVLVTNDSEVAAHDVVVDLPLPIGATPLTKHHLTESPQGWRWTLDRLDGLESKEFATTIQLSTMPKGEALLVHATVTAREFSIPVQAVGGAVVEDSTSTKAASIPFIRGKAAVLRSADKRVEVAIPADLSTEDLRLSHRSAAQKEQEDKSFTPPRVLAGIRQGFGTFVLDATDTRGKAVHLFDRPVTIKVSYTPEQLQALGISEADLTIFWFDETKKEWVPQPTAVDSVKHVASIRVDHFSAYALGDGSSPSEEFIPSVQGWQVGIYTGAANYSMPIQVPAGPRGVKPPLDLGYSSASSDGKRGLRAKGQAGWVGKDWSLDTGSIAANKIAVNGSNTVTYYSLVLNGRSYDLVKAEALPGNSGPGDTNPTHWAWRPTDESFIKVRVVDNGVSTANRGGFSYGNPYKRYLWQVWTKDGTRFDFAEDLWWGFNECLGGSGDYAYMETYKWELSKAVDVHGNTITYNYGRFSQTRPATCAQMQGTVDLDSWPTSITWGGNITTGAIDRHKVEFVVSNRGTNQDTAFDGASNQYGGVNGQPRETKRLDTIRVLSMAGTVWELVRQYNFGYDYSLLSDNTVSSGGTYTGNTAYPRTTLKSVTRVGKDGITSLPAMTFAYGMNRGSSQFPNGDWNRLTTINNGQGGTMTFAYANIATATGKSVFANNRRIVSKTMNDGRGHSYTASYAYTSPAYNSLGSILDPGGNATQQFANSAALYYNKYSSTSDNSGWLLHRAMSEFRGHGSVIETDPNGNQTEHWFYQGDVSCNPTATGAQITSDACFINLRNREMLKGKEYRTVSRGAAGSATLAETQRSFTVGSFDYTTAPLSGLWRAFSYESETVDLRQEGTTTPVTKRTKYFYDPAFQNNAQYGNVTKVEEYDGATFYRHTEYRYLPLDSAASYIVDRKITELVKDSSGVALALTNYAYDGNSSPLAAITRGDQTLVRKYFDITPSFVFGTTTLHSTDTSYGYDAYGNRTTVTTYAQPGTRLGNTFSAPGNGSAASTTTTTYDSVFHTFSVQVDPPVIRVPLTERAAYDYRMGTMTSVTDANNNTTSAEYDVFGRMVKLIKPGDSSQVPTIRATYYDTALPFKYKVEQREVSGQAGTRVAQQFYDGLGRKIQIKNESRNGAQNVVVDMEYNGLNQVVRQSQPRFVDETSASFDAYTPLPASGVLFTTTTYDPLGRPLVVTTPNGAQSVHHYGVSSGMTYDDVIDPNRHRIHRRTDTFGRLAQVMELKGTCGSWGYTCAAGETAWATEATTTYAYSPLDLLTKVTDAQNNVTAMTYDSLGRKLTMADPDMGLWTYTYDVGGNLITQRDARGQTITFGYDVLNRLISKKLPNTGGTIVYNYDEDDASHAHGRGQRTSMIDLVGAHHWAYTARGEVAQDQLIAGGTTYLTKRTYRTDGQFATLTYPTGEILSYVYNDAGQQLAISSSLGGSYLSDASYDALGQKLLMKYGNAVNTTYTYEATSKRLSTIDATGTKGTVFKRAYTYDPVGNVQTIGDPLANEVIRYGYDQRDRLTAACIVASATTPACLSGSNFNQTYSYDLIGNLTIKAGATYSYTGGRPHAVSAVNGAAYSYDANGNMLSGAGRTYTWNAENQPTQITSGSVTETYAYDGDNNRVKKISSQGGNLTTTLYVGGLVAYSTGNKVVSTYGSIAVRTTTGNPTVTNPGTLVFLHSDHLDSVSVTTTGGGPLTTWGAVVQSQNFDPWGAVRSGGITATESNFTGQRKDAGTGLLFYNARYYDASLARFVSADSIVSGNAIGIGGGKAMLGYDSQTALRPLTVDFHEAKFITVLSSENAFTQANGFWFQLDDNARRQATYQWGVQNPQALNRYAYVLDNPLRYVDPTGHLSAGWQTWKDRAHRTVDIWHENMNNQLTDLKDFLIEAIDKGTKVTIDFLKNLMESLPDALRNVVQALIDMAIGEGLSSIDKAAVYYMYSVGVTMIAAEAVYWHTAIEFEAYWGDFWGDAPPGRDFFPVGRSWSQAWNAAK